MMKRTFFLVVLGLTIAAAGGLATVVAANGNILPLDVEKDAAWTALFDRTSGWTGGDGIFSIPLSGDETPDSHGPTLFVFSDTFIGEVGQDGKRQPGTTLINNTLAVLDGDQPDPNRIRFFWPTGDDGKARAMFVPETQASQPGDWYWLMDGIAIGDEVHIFALRMEEGDGGVFNFAIAGVSMLTLPLVDGHPIGDHTQVDTPLHRANDLTEDVFGSAIMPNTAEAGAPFPDGYVYVYGYRNTKADGNKRPLVARVLPQDFADFSAWRYWDGAAWSADPAEAATLDGVELLSAESSVTPLPDGQFAMVYQLAGIARETVVRLGTSPLGPFGDPIVLWSCPEPDADPYLFCYNAKAHPHLSNPGELLISYNVNTFDGKDHIWADIYRPRFIRVQFQP